MVARIRSILFITVTAPSTVLSSYSINVSERLCLRLSSGRDPTTVSSRNSMLRVMSGERMFRTVLTVFQGSPVFSTPRMLRLLLPLIPQGATKGKSIHIKILIILSLIKASLPLTPTQQFQSFLQLLSLCDRMSSSSSIAFSAFPQNNQGRLTTAKGSWTSMICILSFHMLLFPLFHY